MEPCEGDTFASPDRSDDWDGSTEYAPSEARLSELVIETTSEEGTEGTAWERLLYSEAEMLMEPATQTEERGNAAKAVRRQLLADACRARYVIDGEEFWFEAQQKKQKAAAACRGSPCNSPAQDRDAGQRFAATLTDAVESCLRRGASGELPLDGLVHLVMLLLTQIGFALTHVACGTRELALCGGERGITYELSRGSQGRWELRGEFRAYGFSQFHAGSGPVECSTASSMHRGFAVSLVPSAEDRAGLQIAVEDAFEDPSLFSTEGLPIEIQHHEPPPPALAVGQHMLKPACSPKQPSPEGFGPESLKTAATLSSWLLPRGAWVAPQWSWSCSSVPHMSCAKELTESELVIEWA